ncbi:MAG: Crp/Fnr family transcriptional regulator [Thermacetogeniaceae bacterium]
MAACLCAGCALWRPDAPPREERLLKELDLISSRRHFLKGDTIFSSEDVCDRAIILRSGAAKLFHQSAQGKELVVTIATPGDVICLPKRRGEKFGINAAALTEGEYCALTRERLSFLFTRFPSIGVFLLEQAQRLLSRAYAAMERLAFLRAEERLAAAILDLARNAGEVAQEGIAVTIPLNLSVLAGLSGVVPETAARLLASWKREGAIAFKRKRLVLREPSIISGILEGKHLKN